MDQPRRQSTNPRTVQISNVYLERIVHANKAQHDLDIVFDVAWENSWREVDDIAGGSNWDAVWLFVKFKLDTSFLLPKDAAAAFWAAIPTNDFDKVAAAMAEDLPNLHATIAQLGKAFAFTAEPIDGGSAYKLSMTRTDEEGGSAPALLESQPHVIMRRHRARGSKTHVRFQMENEVEHWQPVMLTPDNSAHTVPKGATIDVAEDGMGAFLYRSSPGRGPVSFEGVKLRWGGHTRADENVQNRLYLWVHGLHMVYVPEGPFQLGDPHGLKGPPNCFFDAITGGTYNVESEDPIPVANKKGEPGLTWNNSRQFGKRGSIPRIYPKGYAGFYCMRGHVSQGEYVDFINSLRGEAITIRYPYLGEGSFRFAIYRGARRRVAARPLRPCNYLSWQDSVAYMWWAGLRPMTELEYEKACRGPLDAVPGEYAWGTRKIDRARIIIGDEGDARDCVDGNCHAGNMEVVLRGGDSGTGPVREDSFGAPGMPNSEWLYPGGLAVFEPTELTPRTENRREITGASYYGVMGMSGNLWEYTVTAGKDRGRLFRAEHGDGKLDESGLPLLRLAAGQPRVEVLSWPNDAGEGVGYRGGAFYPPTSRSRLADRYYASGLDDYTTRSMDTGIRGVRSAPRRREEY